MKSRLRNEMNDSLAIIVHGGAWYIPPEDWAAHKAGCRAAAIAGFAVLGRGGDALDAVETAIVTTSRARFHTCQFLCS